MVNDRQVNVSRLEETAGHGPWWVVAKAAATFQHLEFWILKEPTHAAF